MGYSKTASGATHAFLWRQGVGMVDLGVLPPLFIAGSPQGSQANAINESGQIAGKGTVCGSNCLHGFIFQPGAEFLDVGPFGSLDNQVRGLNNSGQAAGVAGLLSQQPLHEA